MSRGTTARTLFVVLAAVLFCVQLLTPAEAFAPAHRGEAVSCGEAEQPQKEAPPLGAGRRTRGEDLVPEPPARALPAHDPAAAPPSAPDPLTAARHRAPISPTAPSPTALQVFRC